MRPFDASHDPEDSDFLLSFALVLGCGRTQTAKRTDQNYQVVQEGQASGVTSTINAPARRYADDEHGCGHDDELHPGQPRAARRATAPNTVAGTLPAYRRLSAARGGDAAARAAADVQRHDAAQPRPRPQQPVQPPPPQTDTTATQSGPPATDTAPETDTGEKTDTTKTDTQPPPQTDTAKTDTTSTEKPPV